MSQQDYTIEDCLEFLVGLSLLPGSHWNNNPLKLVDENRKVLYSIGTQVFRGKALTEKQHELVKNLFVQWYVDQFQSVGIDIHKHLNKIREPYRQVDKSHWVKILKKDDSNYIAIRFPFSNTVIEHINDLKQTTDTNYFYDKHVHHFLWSEMNVYRVMTIANKFKEKFDIDPDVQEYFNEIIEFEKTKNNILPGVLDYKFKNINEELVKYLNTKYPVINDDNIVGLWDKRRLYGLHMFQHIDISKYSTLGKKFLERENGNVVIRSEVWNIKQVLNALLEIDRFPLVIALDTDTDPLDQLSTVYNALNGFINNENISVMFRLDNKSNEEFNQFIRDKRLNNSVDNNTQVVIVNRKKITKPIIKSQWQPVCMLTFGQSRGYGSIFSTYIEQFDLKIFYTKEDSIISTYTRPVGSYHSGVTTI